MTEALEGALRPDAPKGCTRGQRPEVPEEVPEGAQEDDDPMH